MKYIILIICIIFSFSSVASSKKKEAQMPEEQKARGTHNINQHIAVAVTLAEFYCEKNSWPKDIEEFKAYKPEHPFPMPVQLEWEFITQPESTFEIGEQIIVFTPPGNKPGEISVKSVNSIPKCEGKNINPNIALTIGKEKT